MYFVGAACSTIAFRGGAGPVFFGGVGRVAGGGDRFFAGSGIGFGPVAGGGGGGLLALGALGPVVGIFPLSFFVGGDGAFVWVATSAYDRGGGCGGGVV